MDNEWLTAGGFARRSRLSPKALRLYAANGVLVPSRVDPVEVCLPIPPRMASATSLPTRVEPAHREAFTTVTRSQVRYPDIVSAYDAVERWISVNNQTVTGAPREVYFADPSAGDDNELVADIAFPIK